MRENLRNSGIGIIGDVPWGTHFRQFYQTKEDLLGILVSYLRAGLEGNELCVWVTSQPATEEEARRAIGKAVPKIDRYLESRQLEIIPYSDWYLKGSTFNSQRVLSGWIDQLNAALVRGYYGLRLINNTFWLERSAWQDFTDYEREVDNVISQHRMIALCTYHLDWCGASEVVDVMSNHQFALIRRQE